MLRARGLLLLWIGLLALPGGCGGGSRPLLKQLTPLNGTTNQDPTVAPTVIAGGEEVKIDAADRRVVLYDVTTGARLTVAGDVETLGPQLVYHPKAALTPEHDFELVVDRGALIGKDFDELDDSESPEEPIRWPFRLAFSLSPRPRVRAAYLDRDQGVGRITVLFSQPMDPVATTPEIQLQDLTTGKPIPVAQPNWPNPSTATLDLKQALDPIQPYRLQVGPTALGANGLRLNSDGDGTGGEPEDGFSAAFTGSQPIILSRQPAVK